VDVRAAFLDAICADPDNDLPRLVYADYLEEQGEEDRAEFIRVQCELARTDDPHGDRYWDGQLDGGPKCYQRRRTLRGREQELLLSRGATWVRPIAESATKTRMLVNHGLEGNEDGICWKWRRGFVEEIALPSADWLIYGPALVQVAPLQVVRLSDREPMEDHSDWTWFAETVFSDHHLRSDVPGNLYQLVPLLCGQFKGWYYRSFYVSFPTKQDALDCLSAACLAWARSRKDSSHVPIAETLPSQG